MTTQTASETSTYEQALLNIIKTLSTERIRQIVDFARFLQLQTKNEHSLSMSGNSANVNSAPGEEERIVGRRPHPALAGKSKTIGDLVSPIVDEEDWECLR